MTPDNHNQSSLLRQWLPIAFTISTLATTLYLTQTQTIRSAADQQPVQIAQDVSAQLFNNKSPTISLPTAEVDIEKSIAPFVVLYNNKGEPTDGSGKIGGKLPALPNGASERAQKQVEYRFTWQPKSGTRVAAVIRYYQNDKHIGYVLSGQNLRETDSRLSKILLITTMGWTVAMLGSLLFTILSSRSR